MKRLNRLKNILTIPFMVNWKKTLSCQYLINRYKQLRAFMMRKHLVKNNPSLLHVEVTNRCNLRCLMCGRTVKDFGGNSDIPFELFKKIVDDAAQMKMEMLILHSWGEPLLHPQIVEMIEYATSKDLPTWMSTNATLLDEQMSLRLLRSGLGGLVFSVDGTTAKTYEFIRKGADFQRTVNNIKLFLELKKKHNKKMMNTIQMIEMEQNRHEADEFVKMWSDYDINIMIKPLVDWYATDIDSSRSGNFVCDKPWFWMKIQSSGKAVPCGHDAEQKYIFGDAYSEKLKDIWNSPAYTTFREEMLKDWKDIDICRSCRYKPPRRRNFISNLAFVGFDIFSLTKMLFTIGYKKDV